MTKETLHGSDLVNILERDFLATIGNGSSKPERTRQVKSYRGNIVSTLKIFGPKCLCGEGPKRGYFVTRSVVASLRAAVVSHEKQQPATTTHSDLIFIAEEHAKEYHLHHEINKMVKSLKDIAPDLRPPTQSSTSKIPEFLLFPTLVVLSLTISSALYSVASVFTEGDLSTVSRSLDDWWEVVGLIGWRIVVLAFGWWGEYDSAQLSLIEENCSLSDPWLTIGTTLCRY